MAQQKVSFKKWWKNITGTKATKVGLFHVELVDSIVYAGVPVQYTVNGQTRCQGYIPTIVSKCGWYLKENATKARGIFRVSGSAKRVSELQLIFDTPPKYGSQLDWTGYTIHDASNVFRRYLNHLPDPVIPLEFYERFRDVHRNLTDEEEQIAAYQELISKLPPPHSCLLMYLLDLLALFAYHSEDNLMDSKNLASVFQPGVISHPNHAMSPGEYMTSAAVLKFLIDHQSSFTMPQPNIDEEDEEMTNFGLKDQQPQHQHMIPNRDSFSSVFRAGGYVNASDHERIHNSISGRGISFEAEDAVRILNPEVRRQHSLHKPIIPHSTLPGNPPQRSKSTNSSISSRHSSQSGIFSNSFLARRRSSRHSRTGSKTLGDVEQDLSDIPEKLILVEQKEKGKDHTRPLTPRDSMVRRAVTSPIIGLDDNNTELSSHHSRRKHMKGDGHRREPSVFCQTIEVQYTINKPPTSIRSHSSFVGSPRSERSVQPNSDPLSGGGQGRDGPRGSFVSTTSHVLIPDQLMEHREMSPHPSQQGPQRPTPGQKRTSIPSRHGLQSTQSSSAIGYDAATSQHPTNPRMPILRTKSNPGELASITTKGMSHIPQGSYSSGSQAIGKFKGLFSTKNRDHDSVNSPRDGDNKDEEKDKKYESSTTDKQRKYRSQEVTPNHLQQGLSSVVAGMRSAPVRSIIKEHESGHIQPPPTLPQPQQQRTKAMPPPRPPPPGPEGSLMDFLDPPQRLGDQHSGHSSPSGGSRSASPARVPSSRQPLSANASFTSTSSARSTSSIDRLHQRRGPLHQGSSSSLEIAMSASADDLHYDPNRNSRQLSPRAPSRHSPITDVFPQNQLHPDQPLSQSQQHQHLSLHVSTHCHHLPPHGTHLSHSPVEDYGGHQQHYRHPHQPSESRSRQGSLGSNQSNEMFDINTLPNSASRPREHRPVRERSSSSVRGDETSPKARSASSKNSSPIHSSAPSSLSASGSGAGYRHHYGSSPLVERQDASYTSLPPSSRARNRAQSRGEQQILQRQQSAIGVVGVANNIASNNNNTNVDNHSRPYLERERSRSNTGMTISSTSATSSVNSSPAIPPAPTTRSHTSHSNNSSTSSLVTSSTITTSKSLRSGRSAPTTQ